MEVVFITTAMHGKSRRLWYGQRLKQLVFQFIHSFSVLSRRLVQAQKIYMSVGTVA